jgi:hypothetical protein
MSARARCIGFALLLLALSVLTPALGLGQVSGDSTAGAQWCCLTCGSVASRGIEKGARGPVAPAVSPTPPAHAGRVDLRQLPPSVIDRATSVGYTKPLAAIYDPADEAAGAFQEKGFVPPGEYKDYGPLPAGYWVYVSPWWSIWDLKNGKRGG